MHKRVICGLTISACLVAGGVVTAQAAVIGATPDTDFSSLAVTFSLGGKDRAVYSLSKVLQNPVFGAAGGVTAGVRTGGSALVSQSTINPGMAAAYAGGFKLGAEQSAGEAYVNFGDSTQTLVDDRTRTLA